MQMTQYCMQGVRPESSHEINSRSKKIWTASKSRKCKYVEIMNKNQYRTPQHFEVQTRTNKKITFEKIDS